LTAVALKRTRPTRLVSIEKRPVAKRHTSAYNFRMKRFEWDSRKNEKLIQERGISFEAVLWSIQSGGLLDLLEHKNPKKYPG
jgi:hypothetical protein